MANYHFIGIKGSGMSAAAQIVHDLGHRVQGEDIENPVFTQAPLEARGILFYAFEQAPLSSDLQVIASNAFDDTHPAIVRCRQAGLAVTRYHHFLGDLLQSYTSIAVTGSHGKTTTTGMLAHALHVSHPTCWLIGDGTGRGEPDARYFVFESCEYRRHFLAYEPEIAIITNIDFDHPDYFSNIDDVRLAFEEMTSRVGQQIIACGDDAQVRLLQSHCRVLYYGFGSENELRAENTAVDGSGTAFDVYYRSTRLERFHVPIHGRHNVLNALAVIGTALVLDANMEQIKRQLATFGGVKRRFSEKAWKGNVLIDDYAHHPSEIRATLEAVRSKYPDKKVVSVFQPHTFTRLEKLLDDFALSLKGADDVFLCPIFGSAREHQGTVSIEHLQNRIPRAQLIFEDTISSLLAYEDSVLVFMGAGDIQKFQAKLEQL